MKGLDVIRKLRVNIKDFYLVFSACLGSVYTTQSRFEQTVLKGRKFRLNLKESFLEFEDGEKLNIQYLGSSNKEGIWMWGWNEKTELPSNLFDFANQIKDFGEVHFTDYLKNAAFKMNKENFAQDLTSTVCAMFGNTCFLEGKGENGSLYVSVEGLPNEIFQPVSEKDFAQITMHALKNHKVNHRLFVEAFLSWNDINYSYKDEILFAEFENQVEIEFIKTEKDYNIKSIKVANPKPKEETLVS